jgi:dipeptidase
MADVFALMRDHFEGTPYDMTKGVDAGPFGSPLRCRPIDWTVDDTAYAWERPISTQQTGFSFVSQSRSWLPNPIGGVYWYGVDDTYTSCYVPLYCGITDLPKSYTVGSMERFSWDSSWWVFNFVANYANLRYVDMVKDIQAVQREFEEKFLAFQPVVEKTALASFNSDPALAIRFLTEYSVTNAEKVVERWRELALDLLTKYNDGYVRDENARPQEKGYPQTWLRQTAGSAPGLRLEEKPTDLPESTLVD